MISQMNKIWLIFIVAIASCSSASSSADRVTISLGSGRSIVVPVPYGFRALGGASSSFRNYSENLETPNNILLEVFLTDSDYADVVAGHSDHRERELKIEDARGAYGVDLDESAYNRAVAGLRNMKEISLKSAKEANAFLESRSLNVPGEMPKVSGTRFLGNILNEPDAVGFDMCGTANKKSGVLHYCVAQIVLHVRDRAVTISVSANVHGKTDFDWMNSTAITWAKQIITMNRDDK